jgi:hypothetical protein
MRFSIRTEYRQERLEYPAGRRQPKPVDHPFRPASQSHGKAISVAVCFSGSQALSMLVQFIHDLIRDGTENALCILIPDPKKDTAGMS